MRDGFFPWEERFADRQFPDGWFDTPYGVDPLAVAEAQQILADVHRAAPGSQVPPITGSTVTAPSGKDPFNSLPLELCSAVAVHLPTPDALNARLASRSFWPVFSSQQFWASRFRGSSDRSWFFEARDLNDVRDWRWLYHRTTDGRIGPGLRNRKRIWGLIQDLAVILDLHWNGLPSELPSPWTRPTQESRTWVLAGGTCRNNPRSSASCRKVVGASEANKSPSQRAYHKYPRRLSVSAIRLTLRE